MNAPAKLEKKDIVRLQFDVRRTQLNIIESLVNICGLSSKKELFSNAMALMKWAVQETERGRRIASYDPDSDDVEVVALPALSSIEVSKISEEVTNEKLNHSIDSSPKLSLIKEEAI